MLINPIKLNFNTCYQNRSCQQKPYQSVNFGVRSEFLELQRVYSNPRYSYFFRRSDSFGNVVDSLKQVFANAKKPKLLIVGVGKGEEPMSYLAVIKNLYRRESLENIVDLNCVDIQPKISTLALKNNSVTDEASTLIYAKRSFNYDIKTRKFYLKSNILDFLVKTFDNPLQSHWDASIEEYSSNSPKKKYNLISMNKVLMYLKDRETQAKVVDNLLDMLKPDGILISDSEHDFSSWDLKNAKTIKEISPGIWQKHK